MNKKNRTLLTSTAVAPILSAMLLSGIAHADGTDYLFFSSDIHNQAGDLYNNIEDLCMWGGTNTCGLIGLVGDFNSQDPTVYNSTPEDIFNLQYGVMSTIEGGQTNLVLTQGNHDTGLSLFQADGSYPAGPVPLSNNNTYEVVRINADDFVWGCVYMNLYLLTSAPSDKVIVVMSHYPLHSTRSGLDQYWSEWCFDSMQSAGAAGQDIVFVWGHNHRTSSYDENARLIAVPGQTIQKGSSEDGLNMNVAGEALEFTYVNAGYTKNWASDPTATTMTVSDSTIFIARHGYDPQFAFVNR